MRRPLALLKKFAILCHRWTGTAFCLLFSWWFISGIFMMYCNYPEVSATDRLAHAQPIDVTRVTLTAAEAWTSLKTKGEPDEVRLMMFDSRPAYQFRLGKARAFVYADNGQVQVKFPPELNLRTAAAWTGLPTSEARAEEMTQEDQWTVGGLYYNYEPLTKYTWPSGEEVYVPHATGEVIQATTRASRILSYLGPIAHWLYFTPLRRNPELWSRVVIWLSGLATVVALLGLVAGFTLYSPSKSIPFSGTKRLHMQLGLFFGFIACTWSFSGMLSMDPFPTRVAGENPRIPEALNGEPFAFENFTGKTPRHALEQVAPSLHAKQLEFVSLGGRAFYLATQEPSATRVIAADNDSAPAVEFDRHALVDLVTKAAQPVGIAEVHFIDRYDSYYLDRHRELPLPVLFLRLRDPQQSRYYIDARTARLAGSYSSDRWPERWLYHGFHSINLAILYNYRPAWDIVVLALMFGGALLSLTSVVIGWRFLRSNARRHARSAVAGRN
jgi:hypothetical protein